MTRSELISIGLQPGDQGRGTTEEPFQRFLVIHGTETVETVPLLSLSLVTGLKPGANERLRVTGDVVLLVVAASSTQSIPHPVEQVLCVFCFLSFHNNANHGFCVRGPHVYPALR